MKVRIINYKKAFPRLQCGEVFRIWFYIDTFYEGKMIHFNVKHYTIEFDFR